MGDGGKGSGRKAAKPGDAALADRLRGAFKRDAEARKSTAENARNAFKKRGQK